MKCDKISVGLIGAGRIGRLHAEHLCQCISAAELIMVADIDAEAARQCAARAATCQANSDYRAVLDHPDIDAVLICSSTDTHARLIEEAAAAGKHVFCEKPIDHELDRIDRALAAVEGAGVLLQIGFNRRFDASFRRAKQAVEEGEIGVPHMVHIVSRDPAPPPIGYIEKSGGMFLDMSIHDLDMARYLISSEVEEIYATGAVRIDPEIGAAGDLDTSVIVLKFTNDVIGTIDNSRQAVYGYDQRVEVFGSGGSISVGNQFPNSAVIRGPDSVYRDLPLNFFVERYVDSYLEEMTQFVHAVRDGGPSPLDGAEGRIPVVMARAAWKSCQENRPVKLSEIDPHED